MEHIFDKVFKTWDLEKLPELNKNMNMMKMWYEGKTVGEIMKKHKISSTDKIYKVLYDNNVITLYNLYLTVMTLKEEIKKTEEQK